MTTPPDLGAPPLRPSLTTRQREVLVLVANGHTNAMIGRTLGLHATTVATHLAQIRGKLGARDRTHAVALALLGGHLTRRDIRREGA